MVWGEIHSTAGGGGHLFKNNCEFNEKRNKLLLNLQGKYWEETSWLQIPTQYNVMLKVGNLMVFSTLIHLEICKASWEWHKCCFSLVADRLMQWSQSNTHDSKAAS